MPICNEKPVIESENFYLYCGQGHFKSQESVSIMYTQVLVHYHTDNDELCLISSADFNSSVIDLPPEVYEDKHWIYLDDIVAIALIHTPGIKLLISFHVLLSLLGEYDIEVNNIVALRIISDNGFCIRLGIQRNNIPTAA